MNKIIVVAGTWIWKHLPVQQIRQGIWSSFLWWVRGKKKVETIDGITFDLDLGEMIDVCIYVHRFEREVTRFIDIACKKHFAVLDIGANIGAHCLRFAQIVGGEGKVYAFEPTDYAYAKLKRNILLNRFGNIQTYQVALSNQNLARQKISCRSSWKSDGSQLQASSVVNFVRLDDWAVENAIERLDIIKIDVDGNEFSVLDGGRDLLNKFKPIVVAEVGAWHFVNFQKNPWSILADMGYRFWDLQSRREYSTLAQMREKLPREDTEMGFSINVVAKIGDSPWDSV
jgi:FkbM family methyltransferase